MRLSGRLKSTGLKAMAGLGLIALAAGMLAPQPAFAYWHGGGWGGGWRGGPGYWGGGYWGPRGYYYGPPVVVVPPPVYYPPPPVYYAPPPVYYAPPAAPPVSAPVVARSCFTPTINCPMTVPRSPGSGCYCTDSDGQRMYGRAE